MPEAVHLEKAELRELIDWNREGEHKVTVQFNPETLKVSYTNQVVPPQTPAGGERAGGDQRGNSTIQFVGRGTTKLTVQLWFDATWKLPADQVGANSDQVTDVQELTDKVVFFIKPQADPSDQNRFRPPGVRFIWGTFQFDGIVESLEESLEFFSSEGKPLRASITLNLSKQDIVSTINRSNRNGAAGAANAAAPGQRAMTQARAGDTVQGVAGRQGQVGNWQAIAAANGIEDPRRLAPGQLLDLNPGPSLGLR